MERLRELIIQLKEQFDRKAEPAQMLNTARLLQVELEQLASQPQPARVMPTKITVMMPSATKMYAGQQNGQTDSPVLGEPRKDIANQRNSNSNGTPAGAASSNPPATAPSSEADSPDARYMPPATPPPAPIPQAPTPMAAASTPAVQPSAMPVPVQEGPTVTVATLEKAPDRGVWPFNPLADKPIDRFTLSQRSREVNDVIGLSGTSLNDKLKSDAADLKSALNDTPVRDLKKAIGVNDRYVFINQLFRGDEVMYERSIKTINGFRILPEAEYWMERELKVKLGWDESRETTRHFYQIVKRRFS